MALEDRLTPTVSFYGAWDRAMERNGRTSSWKALITLKRSQNCARIDTCCPDSPIFLEAGPGKTNKSPAFCKDDPNEIHRWGKLSRVACEQYETGRGENKPMKWSFQPAGNKRIWVIDLVGLGVLKFVACESVPQHTHS
eukprot:s5041_g3.t1